MIVLWILLGILALLGLLLMLPFRLHVVYQEDFSVTLRLLGVPIHSYPRKKEAPARRAKKKKQAKRTQEQPLAKSTGNKKEPTGVFTFLRRFLRILLEKCRGYLRVRVKRIRVSVATEDPAKTAILFGAVNAAVVYLLELLDRYGNWDGKKRAELWVQPDFTATKTVVDVHLVLSLRVWQMFAILLQTFITQLKEQEQNKA